MRAQSNIFWVLAVFFFVADAAYTVWSLLSYEFAKVEWTGTLGIGLAGIMSIFLGYYMNRSHAAQSGDLPEDRLDANIDDGDPEIGFFNPWSWWPIILAAGCTLVFLGLAVGMWIIFFGAALTTIALVGWVFENYRGIHQH
ncbi:Cytochrome c oxidase polypeptide 4 [Frondihabitans sp. 762G35]|uniref:cytochrome c oxidase subunit 4 n=1 Tax=Frondihabitans sp. 762G35 TaxID=1446794 RepID=UPI000D20001F|nr:cytochrome c oxidase subunit 4 [Frondihabitans sp. 762G35]ARC56778.1 Cytochrome c oxidase polypeptide 4 [Frondihabitans sp. 762G35]